MSGPIVVIHVGQREGGREVGHVDARGRGDRQTRARGPVGPSEEEEDDDDDDDDDDDGEGGGPFIDVSVDIGIGLGDDDDDDNGTDEAV